MGSRLQELLGLADAPVAVAFVLNLTASWRGARIRPAYTVASRDAAKYPSMASS